MRTSILEFSFFLGWAARKRTAADLMIVVAVQMGCTVFPKTKGRLDGELRL